jgi:probable HAF family extracellular repeat protein
MRPVQTGAKRSPDSVRSDISRRYAPMTSCPKASKKMTGTLKAAAILLAFILGTSAQAAVSYSVTDLGTLGGSHIEVYGINASGQVTGVSAIAGDTALHAFFYSGTSMIDLGTLGGLNSQGFGINASGTVTGDSRLSNGDFHAFSWNGTSMTDLGTLGGSLSQGFGINASGQVAGVSTLAANSAGHAVLWNGTSPTDLGTLGGSNSIGRGINDLGQVTDNPRSQATPPITLLSQTEPA